MIQHVSQAISASENPLDCLNGDPASDRVFLDLMHEIRQPLSVIECLAYFLEITATEEKVLTHATRIQSMVGQVNAILQRKACGEGFHVREQV